MSDAEQKVLIDLKDSSSKVQQLKETLNALNQAVNDAEQATDVEATESKLRTELAQFMEQHKSLVIELQEANKRFAAADEEAKANENVQTLRTLFANLSAAL